MTRLRQTLRTPDDLIEAGLVAPERGGVVSRVAARYAVAITPAMAELIDAADADDPIARQFVPDPHELDLLPAELADPIGDHPKTPVKGLVHRYRDRVLLKIVGACAVYCRFCFRREMIGPASEMALSEAELDAALAYVRAHPEIWEVILTGGDPLVLSPRRIGEVAARLGEIAHVKVLRWHTRVPVVAPERITAELVAALKSAPQTVYVAIHANHPRELTSGARAALAQLADAGIPLVSQTVLLRGVNDDAATLETLMRAFVEARVTPYYLHHGDLAPGTAHLRTTIAEGQRLMAELRRRVSGLALPTYVLDIPGGHDKVPAGPSYLTAAGAGAYAVEDPSGARHTYQDCCSAAPPVDSD
jgi:lysine 2,3-aminomutase